MKRLDVATLALLALCAGGILSGLGRFPALTCDEAWVGLYAGRLAARGLFTPHEMNTYTGPLFGLAIMNVFAVFGTGVRSLRLFGAGANVLAFVLLAAHLRRRGGATVAAWWALALTASVYLLLKSRQAWECYALQPLLLALTFWVLDGPASWPRAFALAALCVIGAQNHFIYLSIPLSLCVLYAARAQRGESGADEWLRASICALGAGAILFLVKPRLTEAAWNAERVWALPLFFALPAFSAAAFATGTWERPLMRLLPRRAGVYVFALGLVAFAVWHGVPLWQVLSGPTLWKRTFSWDAPAFLDAPLWLWGTLVLAVAAWRAVRAGHGREGLTSAETTLALWPAAYAAIFILFRNTSSFRYYSLIQFLTLASAAAGLARLPRPDRRWALALGVCVAVAAQSVFWRELRAPAERRPLRFKICWHSENSWDFARNEALFAAFDASGACGIGQQDNFVFLPLAFHHVMGDPHPCDPSRTFTAVQCPDCVRPPFFHWETGLNSAAAHP
ncbi:MAG: hypothetical protein HKL90_03600 [Elusimicrobia bacterium]|nr:hypothetical protein [Elusimicrobiota bacterium]